MSIPFLLILVSFWFLQIVLIERHVSICHLVWKLALGLCGLVIQDVMDVSCSRYITYTEYNILARASNEGPHEGS